MPFSLPPYRRFPVLDAVSYHAGQFHNPTCGRLRPLWKSSNARVGVIGTFASAPNGMGTFSQEEGLSDECTCTQSINFICGYHVNSFSHWLCDRTTDLLYGLPPLNPTRLRKLLIWHHGWWPKRTGNGANVLCAERHQRAGP